LSPFFNIQYKFYEKYDIIIGKRKEK